MLKMLPIDIKFKTLFIHKLLLSYVIASIFFCIVLLYTKVYFIIKVDTFEIEIP